MRRAGDVCFSQVFRDRGGKLDNYYSLVLPIPFCGVLNLVLIALCNFLVGMTGIVDYTNYDDMKYAVS